MAVEILKNALQNNPLAAQDFKEVTKELILTSATQVNNNAIEQRLTYEDAEYQESLDKEQASYDRSKSRSFADQHRILRKMKNAEADGSALTLTADDGAWKWNGNKYVRTTKNNSGAYPTKTKKQMRSHLVGTSFTRDYFNKYLATK